MKLSPLLLLNVALLGLVVAAVPMGIKAVQPVVQNNKAVAALEAHNYDQAIALLSDTVRQNPANKTFRSNLLAAYHGKAVDLDKRGAEKEALLFYENALGLEPANKTILANYISSLNNLAVARSKEKNYSAAQEFFEKAVQRLATAAEPKLQEDIRRNYSALLTIWGVELMKRNQVDEAKTSFRSSLLLSPANAVANIYLGDLLYEANNYPESKTYYSAAMALDKENAEYLSNRLQMIEDESALEPNFLTHEDKHHRFLVQSVSYQKGVPLEEVLALLNEAYETINQELGIVPSRRVNVKIYDGKDFYKVSKLPEWAIGIFDGKMRLKVEDVQSSREQVRDLLFHEYTHAVLAMNVKQRIPAWFHEGLAQLMEPQFAISSREQAQMRDALSRRSLNFAALQDSFKDFTDKADAESAYLLSKYFLVHLNRQQGREKLLQWIKALAAEEGFNAAFQRIYGRDLKTAQDEWMRGQGRPAVSATPVPTN